MAFLGTIASCLMILLGADAHAEDREPTRDVIALSLDIIGKTLKCPLPPRVVSNEDDGRFKVVDKISKTFSGDAHTLEVTGTNRRHFFDGNWGRSAVANRTFEYRAAFDSLAGAITDASEVKLSCSNAKPCINHSLAAPECNFTLVETADYNGSPQTAFNMLTTMTLSLCSPQAAEQFTLAFDAIVERTRASQPKDVDISGLIERSETTGGAGKLFRVLNSGSDGILNLRSGPNPDQTIVVAIPGGADDVEVRQCRQSKGGKKPWCKAPGAVTRAGSPPAAS
jgi:hypothetical protein